ncbi:MAG: hypothetical protein WBP58_15410 [Chitinophagaceae bacterium]
MIFVEKFYIYFCFILAAIFMARLLYRYLWFRWMMIVLLSIACTLMTILFFNEPGSDWTAADQKSLISETNAADTSAYRFIRDHFILVDNSYDKQLLPNEDFDGEDSLVFTITDRNKLTSFFRVLANQASEIDLVVCDIGFNVTTPADSLLRKEMNRLMTENKLLMSGGVKSDNPLFRFPDSITGNIVEQTTDYLFVSHHMLTKKSWSLPYQLYQRLDSIKPGKTYFGKRLLVEKDQLGQRHIAVNPFFPVFRLTNENMLLYGFKQDKDSMQSSESNTYPFFHVGEVSSDLGQGVFVEDLQKRKKQGKRNIIFLGSFVSTDEDIHRTIYKPLHGPVILLNIYYAMHEGSHRLSLAFVLILFLGFLLVNALVIYRAFDKKLVPGWNFPMDSFRIPYQGESQSGQIAYSILQVIINIFVSFFTFLLVEELHFTVLFALGWLLLALTGQVVNIVFLVSYFGIFYICLKYAYEHMIKPGKHD